MCAADCARELLGSPWYLIPASLVFTWNVAESLPEPEVVIDLFGL